MAGPAHFEHADVRFYITYTVPLARINMSHEHRFMLTLVSTILNDVIHRHRRWREDKPNLTRPGVHCLHLDLL